MLAITTAGVIGFSYREEKMMEQQQNFISKKEQEEYNSKPRVVESYGEEKITIDENGKSTGKGTVDSPGWGNVTALNFEAIKYLFSDTFGSEAGNGEGLNDVVERGEKSWWHSNYKWIDNYVSDPLSTFYDEISFKLSSNQDASYYDDYVAQDYVAGRDLFLSIKEENGINWREIQSAQNGSDRLLWDLHEVTPGWHIEHAMFGDDLRIALKEDDRYYNQISSTGRNVEKITTGGVAVTGRQQWFNAIENSSPGITNQGFKIKKKDAEIKDSRAIAKDTINVKLKLPITVMSDGGISNYQVDVMETGDLNWKNIGSISTVDKIQGDEIYEEITDETMDTSKGLTVKLTPDNNLYSTLEYVIPPFDLLETGTLVNKSVSSTYEMLILNDFVNGTNDHKSDKYQVVKVKEGLEDEVLLEDNISNIVNNEPVFFDLSKLNGEVTDIKIKFYNMNFDLINYSQGLLLGETNTIRIDPVRNNVTGDIEIIDLFSGDNGTSGNVRLNFENLSLFNSVEQMIIKATNLENGEVFTFDKPIIDNTQTSISTEINIPGDLGSYVFSVGFGYTVANSQSFTEVQTFESTKDDLSTEPPEGWTTWGTLYKKTVKENQTNLIAGSVDFDNSKTTEDSLSIAGSFNIGNNEFGQYKGNETFSLIIEDGTGNEKIIEPKLLGEENLLKPGNKTFNLQDHFVDLELHGLEPDIEYDIGIILTKNLNDAVPIWEKVWTDKIKFKTRLFSIPEIKVQDIKTTSATIITNGMINGTGYQKASTYKLELIDTENNITEYSGNVLKNKELSIQLENLVKGKKYSFTIEFYKEGSETPLELQEGVITRGSFETPLKDIMKKTFSITTIILMITMPLLGTKHLVRVRRWNFK